MRIDKKLKGLVSWAREKQFFKRNPPAGHQLRVFQASVNISVISRQPADK